ncbi:hypothetical protein HDU87_004213 [Geranomyces variabilis]|uniref:Uncharacterized protein n=1 Tax=Geranomyces variabilis TaxID=109894 RepID=A0AAD5XQ62_9FUNG|nr:hypothetical protein HDU87_004213 [Geranomyces variabilis]
MDPPAPLENKLILLLSSGQPAVLPLAASLRAHGANLLCAVTDSTQLTSHVTSVFATPAARPLSQTLNARAITLNAGEVAALALDLPAGLDAFVWELEAGWEDDVVAVLEGMRRALRSGGTVVLVGATEVLPEMADMFPAWTFRSVGLDEQDLAGVVHSA